MEHLFLNNCLVIFFFLLLQRLLLFVYRAFVEFETLFKNI